MRLYLLIISQIACSYLLAGFPHSLYSTNDYGMFNNSGHFRSPKVDTGFFGATIGVFVNLSTHTNSSHLQLNASVGYTQIYGNVNLGINLALNLANGGFGLPHGQRGNGIRGNLIAGGAVTIGGGQTGYFIPVNTLDMGSHSSTYQNYRYSFTTAQNLVFDSKGLNQRIGSTGFRISEVDFHIYNDAFRPMFLLFGDRGDQGLTGGGSLTIHNLFGNRNLDLTIGSEVFTGRSVTDNSPFDFPFRDRHGRYRLYANQTSFDPAAKPGYNESLNMGRTYLRLNNQWGSFSVSHAGVFDMFSQNLIHDHINVSPPIAAPDGSLITTFHHFRSTTANQWVFSGGGFYRN